MAMPPPRRAWWPMVFVLGCLAAAAIFAVSLYRSPGTIDIAASWNALRAAVVDRIHLAVPASAPAESSAPPAETLPPPETAPSGQAAPTPAPAPEALAASPAPARVASVTVPPSESPAATSTPLHSEPPAPAPAPTSLPAPSAFALVRAAHSRSHCAQATATRSARRSDPVHAARAPRPSEVVKNKTVAKATVPMAAQAAPTSPDPRQLPAPRESS
jgi:hypothetical protein